MTTTDAIEYTYVTIPSAYTTVLPNVENRASRICYAFVPAMWMNLTQYYEDIKNLDQHIEDFITAQLEEIEIGENILFSEPGSPVKLSDDEAKEAFLVYIDELKRDDNDWNDLTVFDKELMEVHTLVLSKERLIRRSRESQV